MILLPFLSHIPSFGIWQPEFWTQVGPNFRAAPYGSTVLKAYTQSAITGKLSSSHLCTKVQVRSWHRLFFRPVYVCQMTLVSLLGTNEQASINQACAITQGSATVTIRDAAGTQVYQANLANNGTFQSMAGQAGNWTIVVTVSNLSGTLNFRVQKL